MSVPSRIFVSYAGPDRKGAEWLADALTESGFHPWIDFVELQPGKPTVFGLSDGLKAAAYLVCLFSSHTRNAQWVGLELDTALRLGTPVIPVLLEPEVEIPILFPTHLQFDATGEKGLESVVRFFELECAELLRGTLSTSKPLHKASVRTLRLVAMACVNDQGLEDFLEMAEIPPGEVAGRSVGERVLSLLHAPRELGYAESFARWLARKHGETVSAQLERLAREDPWNA